MQIDFPPLWTPTAKEMADISKAKAEAIISVFQAGLIRADSAQKELKRLAEESGMFGNITDDEIAANAGKTYQDVTALRDPLAGLSFETPERETGGEATSPFESAAQDAAASYTEDKSGRYIQLPNGKMNGSRSSGLTNAAGQPIIEVEKVQVQGPPNGITQKVNAKGGIDRNYYGADGKQTKQISNNGHGHKKEEAMGLHGEHAHDYELDEQGNPHHLEARELTDAERRENNDILKTN